MIRRHLQKFAMYSLSSMIADAPENALTPLEGAEKEMEVLLFSRKVGESILVPAQGLTVQIAAISKDRVCLQITLPSETAVFRMGVPFAPDATAKAGAMQHLPEAAGKP